MYYDALLHLCMDHHQQKGKLDPGFSGSRKPEKEKFTIQKGTQKTNCRVKFPTQISRHHDFQVFFGYPVETNLPLY